MTADDWTLVKKLFEGALNFDPAERTAWLANACRERPAIHREVESLLASHWRAGDFLDEPALSQVGTSRTGRVIGHYRLTSLIGEGGMGAVYRAVRTDDFEQEVAIKLSKYVASDVLTTQFRKERQILARLDHPNIARLFDGGSTEDGLSYFVMELVDGKPLDRFCEQHPLLLPDRLRLFRDICSAVQYAHQRLIIHQDIKPGNILVTGSGIPKLLDFGIARVLSPAADSSGSRTIALSGVMTPEYASPEQVCQEQVTTATDVYSLGVIFYQLVTGQLPYTFKARTPQEVEAIVCGVEPKRPSDVVSASGDRKMRRALAGDLDNIVLKALRKDPQQRYASAGELAEDIQRFLDDLPVTARPPTFTYRVGKVVARYKTAVAGAAFVIIALLLGLAGTLWQAHVARIQRQHAEQRFREVRQLAESLLFEIHGSIENLPGATAARKLVVEKALQYLDNLAREDRSDQEVQTELGSAYLKIGEIQGLPGRPNLGDSTGAVASFQKSIALLQSVVNVRPRLPGPRLELSNAYGELGRVLISMGKKAEAMDVFGKAFMIRSGLYRSDSANWENVAALGTAHWELGVASNVVGDFKSSLEHRKEAVRLWEDVVKLRPIPANRRSLALMYKTLAAEQRAQTDSESSLVNLRKALLIDEELLGGDPENATARMALATSYSEFGTALDRAGKPAQALEYYQKSATIRASLVALDPKDRRTLGALAFVQTYIAATMIEVGRASEALTYANRALAIQERQAHDDPENASGKAEMGYTLGTIGSAHQYLASIGGTRDRAAAHWESARSYYDRAARLYQDLLPQRTLDAFYRDYATNIEKRLLECDRRISQLRAK